MNIQNKKVAVFIIFTLTAGGVLGQSTPDNVDVIREIMDCNDNDPCATLVNEVQLAASLVSSWDIDSPEFNDVVDEFVGMTDEDIDFLDATAADEIPEDFNSWGDYFDQFDLEAPANLAEFKGELLDSMQASLAGLISEENPDSSMNILIASGYNGALGNPCA